MSAISMRTSLWQNTGRVLLIILCCLPLITLPVNCLLYNALDTPRCLLLSLLAAGLAGCVLFAWSNNGHLLRRPHPLDMPVLFILLAFLVCGCVGCYPRISFFTPFWAMDNTLLLLWALVLVYFAITCLLHQAVDVEKIVLVIVLIGGLVALIGLLDFAFNLHLNAVFAGKRLIGTLGNPMYAGTYFAMLIPLALGLAHSGSPHRRRWVIAALALMLPALALTQARAAWLSVVLTLLCCLLLFGATALRGHMFRRANLMVLLPAILAVAVMLFSVPQVRERIFSLANSRDATIQTRLVYMRGAWQMFLARPLLGWGPGNESLVLPQYRPSSKAGRGDMTLNTGFATALPHNFPLQIASEMGLLGLCAFIWLWLAIAWTGIRMLRGGYAPAGLTIGLLGALLANLLSNLGAFDNSATISLNWTLLGLLAVLSAQQTPAVRPLPCWFARGLSTVALLLMATVAVGVGCQGLQAYEELNGVRCMDGAREAAQQDRVAGWQLSALAIPSLRKAIALTPVTYYASEELLYLAERERLDWAPDAQSAARVAEDAHRAGYRTLALMERDWRVLRFLSLQLIAEGDPGKAEPLVKKLLIFEPHSAEALLLSADLHEAQGRMDDALQQTQQAVQLDPTCAEAHALLAHHLFYAAPRSKGEALSFFNDACAHYEAAQRLGYTPPPSFRSEYVQAALFTHHMDSAIAATASLQGTPEGNQLRATLEQYAQIPALAYDVTRLLAQMR